MWCKFLIHSILHFELITNWVHSGPTWLFATINRQYSYRGSGLAHGQSQENGELEVNKFKEFKSMEALYVKIQKYRGWKMCLNCAVAGLDRHSVMFALDSSGL